MKKCPNCNNNDAQYSATYGILPCVVCQELQSNPKKAPEFTTERVKEDRKKHKDLIIQPFREGQLSKEYIDKYGTKNLNATPEEIKNAKNVWKSDLEYYK